MRAGSFSLLLALIFLRPAGAVSLAEAVDAAASRMPGGQLAAAHMEESRAIAEQAGSLFASDPAFMLQHYNDSLGSDDGLREWDAAVNAPIWLPGQRPARRSVANAAVEQAAADTRAGRWEAAGMVRERLWEVLIARARVEHLERALADARRLQNSVEQRVRAGDLPRSELLLAQRETLSQEAALAAAEGERSAAEDRWEFRTGFTELPSDYRETKSEIANVDADHPGLARLMAGAERATAERNQAESDRRANPVLSLGAKRERGIGEGWDDAFAVGLTVPFGLPAQSAPARAAAHRALVEAAAARETERHNLQEDLFGARRTLDASRRALEAAQKVDTLAAESLRLAQAAFDVGETDLFTFLQVRTQALDAAWNHRQTELDVGRNIARYNQAAGVVP